MTARAGNIFSLDDGLFDAGKGCSPAAHFLVAGAVLGHKSQCRGRAGLHAHRLAAAQVTLADYPGVRIVIDGAKWAGDGADLAANTPVRGNLRGAGGRIQGNSLNRADHHAPGLFTLAAGRGHVCCTALEDGDLYNRLGGVEHPDLTVGAHHLALVAASAGIGLHQERFMHSLVLCYPLMGPALSIFYPGPAATERIPILHAGGPDTTGPINTLPATHGA